MPTSPAGMAGQAASRRSWPDGDPDAPWPMLFSLRGRISRKRFWLWGVAAMLAFAIVLQGLLAVARVRLGTAEQIVNLLLLWPLVAVSVKRWHDGDRPGWWVLVLLVPVVGWLGLLLANGLLPGTRGANRYGPPPAA